jgi:hypothetical protein
MTYIILRDTLGRGLKTISNIDLDVFEKDQLDEYICDAAEIIADEDGYGDLSNYLEHADCVGDSIVICEILTEIKFGTTVSDYVFGVVEKRKNEKEKEEYELYLKLKEKFDK